MTKQLLEAKTAWQNSYWTPKKHDKTATGGKNNMTKQLLDTLNNITKQLLEAKTT